MTDQRKTPGGGNRAGAGNIERPHNIVVKTFPQEPMLFQAYRECARRYEDDPNPINRMIAHIVATRWEIAFMTEAGQ